MRNCQTDFGHLTSLPPVHRTSTTWLWLHCLEARTGYYSVFTGRNLGVCPAPAELTPNIITSFNMNCALSSVPPFAINRFNWGSFLFPYIHFKHFLMWRTGDSIGTTSSPHSPPAGRGRGGCNRSFCKNSKRHAMSCFHDCSAGSLISNTWAGGGCCRLHRLSTRTRCDAGSNWRTGGRSNGNAPLFRNHRLNVMHIRWLPFRRQYRTGFQIPASKLPTLLTMRHYAAKWSFVIQLLKKDI